MKLFFNYGIKIAFANLFGFTFHLFFILMGILIFGSTILLFTISTSIIEFFQIIFSGQFQFDEFFSVLSFENSPIWALSSGFVLLFYCLYQAFIQSMMIGGFYGASVHSVFDEQASIGSYFSYSFRNLGRLTRLQLLLLVLSIPMFILITFVVIGLETLVNSPNIIYFQLSFSLLLILLFLTLFLHSPIFIIKNQTGAWRSIQLSLELLKRAPYSILFSAVVFFAILAIINGLYIGTIFILFPSLTINFTELSFDTASIETIFIMVTGTLFWLWIVLPYSLICALLMLVKRYQLNLHHLTQADPGSLHQTDQHSI